jgi:hypothetical protein
MHRAAPEKYSSTNILAQLFPSVWVFAGSQDGNSPNVHLPCRKAQTTSAALLVGLVLRSDPVAFAPLHWSRDGPATAVATAEHLVLMT